MSSLPTPSPPVAGVRRTLLRGLRRRCPRCGEGRLFDGFYRLRTGCSRCGLAFPDSAEDHLGVMYLTTAVQTAVFAGIVLLTLPTQSWPARVGLAAAALAVMFANMPNRKGFAIALDWLMEGRSSQPGRGPAG